MNTAEVSLHTPSLAKSSYYFTNSYVQMKESVKLFESWVVIQWQIQKSKMAAAKPEVRVSRLLAIDSSCSRIIQALNPHNLGLGTNSSYSQGNYLSETHIAALR